MFASSQSQKKEAGGCPSPTVTKLRSSSVPDEIHQIVASMPGNPHTHFSLDLPLLEGFKLAAPSV